MTGFTYDAQSRCLRTICFDIIYMYMCVCVYAKFFINNFRLYIYLTHLDSVHHQLYDPLVSTYLLIFFQIHEERAFFSIF